MSEIKPTEEQLVTEQDGMDIDSALVLYRNLQFSINNTIDELVSPVTKNGKRKNTNTRLYDLITLGNVLKVVVRDLDIDTKQFEENGDVVNAKALNLYSQVMAVMKAKDTIKEDLRNKVANNEVEGLSEELRKKVLKELK